MVKGRIAIIPARASSKRIPNKNIIDFNGKPMIAWTISAAKESNLFEKILVSTDCDEIAKISIEMGAEVPFLREKYSDDYSPISLATIEALKQAESFWGKSFRTIVQLMANCPLRDAVAICEAVKNFEESKSKFQISCTDFSWMNPWWAFSCCGENNYRSLFPEEQNSRSQDLEKLYFPTGAIWIARRDALIKSQTFYGGNYQFAHIDWLKAIDIDNWEDLKIALILSRANIGVQSSR